MSAMCTIAVALLSLVLPLLNCAELKTAFKPTAPFTITPTDFFKSHTIQPGFMVGARDCGGSSRTIQFTHDHCAPLFATVCAADINKPWNGHAYFDSSDDVHEVIVRASVNTTKGEARAYEFPLVGTTLRTGQTYVLHAVGTVEQELLGRVYTGRLEILRADDKSVVLCAEADLLPYTM